MPWFPIKGVVYKLRMERDWTREVLAGKANVKIRTIRLWESEEIPRTGHDDTVRGLAAAFGVKPEQIADWLIYDPEVDDLDRLAGSAPAQSTLALRAARDDVGEWLALPSGERLELMSPRLLHRIKTAPGLCAEKRYAIAGKVRDHRDMPSIVGAVLKTEFMVCGQFLLLRRVNSGDICYVTVFTSSREQTARLLDVAESKQSVTVIVRLVVREPDQDFKGFFIFQKKGEKPKANKWCFVVDEVTDGSLTIGVGSAGTTAAEPDEKSNAKPRRRFPRSTVG